MLTTLGARAPSGDAVEALLECHDRIRSFTTLALRLATTPGLPERDVREAAEAVHRYFSSALPLHARDEEESLLPRLRGLDAALDRELAAMHREHEEHEGPTDRVLRACAALREHPAGLPELAGALAAAAGELQGHFEVHLAREERLIFPAVRDRLDAATRDAIRAEMRARRAP